MATAQENAAREAKETRDAFEDLKVAVSGRLDALTKQVTDLQTQLGASANDPAVFQQVADQLDGVQTDMKALADSVRGSSPTSGGVTVDPGSAPGPEPAPPVTPSPADPTPEPPSAVKIEPV